MPFISFGNVITNQLKMAVGWIYRRRNPGDLTLENNWIQLCSCQDCSLQLGQKKQPITLRIYPLRQWNALCATVDQWFFCFSYSVPVFVCVWEQRAELSLPQDRSGNHTHGSTYSSRGPPSRIGFPAEHLESANVLEGGPKSFFAQKGLGTTLAERIPWSSFFPL